MDLENTNLLYQLKNSLKLRFHSKKNLNNCTMDSEMFKQNIILH